MKMKKLPLIVGLLLVSVLVMSAMSFGCAPPPTPPPAPPPTPPPPPPPEEAKYVWQTPPPGGTLYITTGALALVFTDVTGIKSYVESVISCDVLQMNVHLGRADFGQSGTPRVMAGYDGTFAPYKGEATNNIRLVMIGPITKTPWFSIKQQADLKSWDEMKGKIIMGGVTGMYMDFAEATLKYHNLWEEIKELRLGIGSPDFRLSLIEGRVDAGFGWSGTHMYDFDAAGGYNIIEQPADEVKAIVEEYGQKGWLSTTLYKDEFGAPQDYQVSGIAVALLTGIHVPEDVVYQVVKATIENNEKLAKIHAKAGMFSEENALVALPCPIHPGAKKYYQEAGMWTDELEAENQRFLDMYGFKK